MQETTANKVAANATSSFTEHLQRDRPELLPFTRPLAGSDPAGQPLQVPHATTIVARILFIADLLGVVRPDARETRRRR